MKVQSGTVLGLHFRVFLVLTEDDFFVGKAT